jgi:hypothetical protein
VKKKRTEFGLKDNYQMFFLDLLASAYKGKRGAESKQKALDAKLSSLPKNPYSPVWRIKGIAFLVNNISVHLTALSCQALTRTKTLQSRSYTLSYSVSSSTSGATSSTTS